MALRGEEIQRKVLHLIFGALLPVFIFFAPTLVPRLSWAPQSLPGWLYPVIVLGISLVFFVVIEYLRFRVPAVQKMFYRFCGSMLRKEESAKLTGATYICASALLCAVVFRNHPHISVMVLSTFIWGDAVAALVGQSVGRTKIGSKSLEGSLSCFALSLILFVAIFPAIPGLLEPWSGKIPFLIALTGALCITILELFPIRLPGKLVINDNLTVPVITGFVLLGMHGILG